jgi:hypothetical protein
MYSDDLIKILQMSLSPVILISGVGLLLLCMTNRLGRTIDRIRVLCPHLKTSYKEELNQLKLQIAILEKRCRHLQKAIVLATLTIIGVSIIILSLFIMFILKINLIGFVETTFAFGLIALIISLLYFLADLALGLQSIRLEVDSHLRSNHNSTP